LAIENAFKMLGHAKFANRQSNAFILAWKRDWL
jgi:hypothetical protein